MGGVLWKLLISFGYITLLLLIYNQLFCSTIMSIDALVTICVVLFAWEWRGDFVYMTILLIWWYSWVSLTCQSRESRAILIHQLSKKLTQRLPFKHHGLPVSSVFHPTRSIFFVATKKNVRVYDLLRQKLIKKLETQLREVSSIAVHPAGISLFLFIFHWFHLLVLSFSCFPIICCLHNI